MEPVGEKNTESLGPDHGPIPETPWFWMLSRSGKTVETGTGLRKGNRDAVAWEGGRDPGKGLQTPGVIQGGRESWGLFDLKVIVRPPRRVRYRPPTPPQPLSPGLPLGY